MIRPSFAGLVRLAGLSFLLGGCSLAYVNGPPQGHEAMESFQCVDAWGVPAFDVVVGIGLIAWGATAGETTRTSFGQPVTSSATDNLVTGLVVGVPFAVSGVWGARAVSRCRAAYRAFAERSAAAAAQGEALPVRRWASPALLPSDSLSSQR